MNFDYNEVINDLRFEVRNFKPARNGRQWQMSCMVCGDSTSSTRKARFGIAIKDGSYVCHCFRCGYSNSLNGYLKAYHPHLYEKMGLKRLYSEVNPLYELNDIVSKADSEALVHIFYIDKTEDPKNWLNILIDKKMKFEKNSIRKLHGIHKEYWNDRRPS